MDSARHQQISEIVNLVLDGAPEERAEILQGACGDDPTLREEVEQLLAEEDALDSGFLEHDALEEQLAARFGRRGPVLPTGATLPENIGSYRVVRLLGEGGMGSVLLAEQSEPYRRAVALKLIQSLDTRTRTRRFLAECQALARLSHPNVAALYDAGTLQDPALGSVPFVSMEWVDGEPITRWCDRRKLDIAQRLALFRGVCAGVQHAHQKGILHCDLKPSNVLVTEVDRGPMAKIIDFGIARALGDPLIDGTQQTTQSFLAGSPAYMSPEAATIDGDRDLDTRSDVYALGVLLYELLVGVLPFDSAGESFWSLLERVRSGAIVAPSSRLGEVAPEDAEQLAARRGLTVARLRRRVRGDLDAIVLKATARDRRMRYSSAEELSDDLERHLLRLPVEARRPTVGYLAARSLRRHWQAAAVSALVLLVLLAGLVARSLEARRARDEAARARAALQESEQLSDVLVELFAVADPVRDDQARQAARELLDRQRSELRSQLNDQPLVKARLLDAIAHLYADLGLLVDGEEAAREGLRLREAAAAGNSELAASLDQLGNIVARRGRLQEAEALVRAGLTLREAEGDGGLSLAESEAGLGRLLLKQGEIEEGQKLLRAALELRRRELPEGHPLVVETRAVLEASASP